MRVWDPHYIELGILLPVKPLLKVWNLQMYNRPFRCNFCYWIHALKKVGSPEYFRQYSATSVKKVCSFSLLNLKKLFSQFCDLRCILISKDFAIWQIIITNFGSQYSLNIILTACTFGQAFPMKEKKLIWLVGQCILCTGWAKSNSPSDFPRLIVCA